MNNVVLLRQVVLFFMYVVVQVFFAKNIELFGVAFCFLYINFILIFPLEVDKTLLLIIGFILGFVIDGFYDTLGIHSAACVFIAYIRLYIVKMLYSKDEFSELSVRGLGFMSFLFYILILVFIHHFLIFFFEIANFKWFFQTLMKVIFSTLFTVIIIFIIQYLFFSPLFANARR